MLKELPKISEEKTGRILQCIRQKNLEVIPKKYKWNSGLPSSRENAWFSKMGRKKTRRLFENS